MRKSLFPFILTLLFTVFGVFANDGAGSGFSPGKGMPFGKADNAKNIFKDEDFGSFKLVVQHDTVKPGAKSALAVVFDTVGDWHFYAQEDTVPGGKLTIIPSAEGIEFGEVYFPQAEEYYDEFAKSTYGIYKGSFKVYVPFTVSDDIETPGKIKLNVIVKGAVCEKLCKMLNYGDGEVLTTTIEVDSDAEMADAAFKLPDLSEEMVERGEDEVDGGIAGPTFSKPVAFSLALIAGLLLNVMPCVWPIIPIIITRLWNLSGQSRAKSIGMGTAFSAGILLFFAIIAGVNIILQVGYQTVFQWGDFNREPAFNVGLSLLMVVMGLFMFGVFSFTLPSSVTGKAGAGKGFSGSVGMGFLLALLSTPCGFGVLAAAFAWAQSQPLWISTITIMLIGVGMALPYIFLTSIPGLINNLPKPGGWMDHVKYLLGFLMLLIAVKILSAVPPGMRINTLYFAVFLSLAVWIWGWVNMTTTPRRKIMIRSAAILIAVVSGWLFLGGSGEKVIDWKDYDAAAIAEDVEQGKPVLIKFTADWCMTCTVIDKLVYNDREFANYLHSKGVQLYVGDTTLQDSPATKALSKVYKEPAVPVTILILPDGEEIRMQGMYSESDLKEKLKSLKDVEENSQQDKTGSGQKEATD